MLIDWLTLSLPYEAMTAAEMLWVQNLGERVVRYCPRTGALQWEVAAWESVRSDSHQLAWRAGAGALHLQGSPARCMGDGDAVFGAVGALDIRVCARAMFDAFTVGAGIALPWRLARCTRIDVTGNLALESLAEVRQALRELRDVEGGRYRVSQTAGDTVYYSHRSRLRAGKCYAKGPHIEYMRKRGDGGRQYSEAERKAAERLLRAELRLGAQWCRERAPCPVLELTPEQLRAEWLDYFGRMVGAGEVSIVDGQTELMEQVLAAAPTEGQGRAAWTTWALVQAHGWQWCRDTMPRRTFYRHLKILRAAGLGDADFSAGRVVSLRRRALVLEPVASWADLLGRAA